jgi:hypothetical protein
VNLVEFSSDKGRGYMYAPVFVNPESVAMVEEVARVVDDNRTKITLEHGEVIGVREDSRTVAKMLRPPATV